MDEVYCPDEDTFLLLDAVSSLEGKNILEIGCGSGAIAVSLARRNNVIAIDLSPAAVMETRKLAAEKGVAVKCFESDLFSNVDGAFDVIIFNPPYLPSQSRGSPTKLSPFGRRSDGDFSSLSPEPHDARYSGGPDGLSVIAPFIRQCSRHLAPTERRNQNAAKRNVASKTSPSGDNSSSDGSVSGSPDTSGEVYLVISSLTGESAVLSLFEENGFSAGVISRKRLFFEELMVIRAQRFP